MLFKDSPAFRIPATQGFAFHARILRQLADGPAATEDLADTLGLCRQSAVASLCGMSNGGLVHIAGWKDRTLHGKVYADAVWCFGPGETVAYVSPRTGLSEPTRMTRILGVCARLRQRTPTVMRLFVRAMAALSREPLTHGELVEGACIGATTASNFLAYARRIGLLYVADWRLSAKGPPSAAYRVGVGQRPKARPKRQTTPALVRARRAGLRERDRMLTIAHALAGNLPTFHALREAA